MKYNTILLDPPGSVVNVTVSPMRRTSPEQTLQGELDTGADIRVIPESLVSALQLKPKEPVLMFGYDKKQSERPTYRVDLKILGYALRMIRVVAAPRDTMMIEI